MKEKYLFKPKQKKSISKILGNFFKTNRKREDIIRKMNLMRKKEEIINYFRIPGEARNIMDFY